MKKITYSDIKVDEKTGLTLDQIKIRKEEKAFNRSKKYKGRSHLVIFISSFFNLFNMILYVYPEAVWRWRGRRLGVKCVAVWG